MMFWRQVKRLEKGEQARDEMGCEWSNIEGWCCDEEEVG